MKKAIAILLVLLVAGVMFGAADQIGDPLDASSTTYTTTAAEMEIQANAAGKFVHGFASASVTSYGKIINYEYDSTPFKTVLLNTTVAQQVAYYLIATNTRDLFSVTLSADRLKSEALVDSAEGSSYYYIPYNLLVGASTVNVNADGTTHALYTDRLNSSGVLAASHQLQFQLPSTLMVDDELAVPEGNYSATITVSVSGI